jgi:thioredoxin 1
MSIRTVVFFMACAAYSSDGLATHEPRSGKTAIERAASGEKDLYPPNADAQAEIDHALFQAVRETRLVILVFGANWCFDCQVFDCLFHDDKIKRLVDTNFVVVHLEVGSYDKILDLAKKYEILLDRGVPALALLDARGDSLYSQRHEDLNQPVC